MTDALKLHPIERINDISREEFQSQYFLTKRPVILRNFSRNWPAMNKWSIDYFKQHYGDLIVPVYKEAFSNTGQDYLSATKTMPFSEYLLAISDQPTNLRMFLFNIFKHVPSLCNDFSYPSLVDHFLEKYPFMFFGGAGSHVDIHYDLDLSDLFLTQFDGKKRIILYPPEYSKYLYRHPLTVSCNVDIGNPDFSLYPKLLAAQGYECWLECGDTLYIPKQYWHYIEYITPGFSLTLRSLSNNPLVRARCLWMIFKLKVVDQNLSRLLGSERWYAIKEKIAASRAKRL